MLLVDAPVKISIGVDSTVYRSKDGKSVVKRYDRILCSEDASRRAKDTVGMALRAYCYDTAILAQVFGPSDGINITVGGFELKFVIHPQGKLSENHGIWINEGQTFIPQPSIGDDRMAGPRAKRRESDGLDRFVEPFIRSLDSLPNQLGADNPFSYERLTYAPVNVHVLSNRSPFMDGNSLAFHFTDLASCLEESYDSIFRYPPPYRVPAPFRLETAAKIQTAVENFFRANFEG
jgi:hypothetical protein